MYLKKVLISDQQVKQLNHQMSSQEASFWILVFYQMDSLHIARIKINKINLSICNTKNLYYTFHKDIKNILRSWLLEATHLFGLSKVNSISKQSYNEQQYIHNNYILHVYK